MGTQVKTLFTELGACKDQTILVELLKKSQMAAKIARVDFGQLYATRLAYFNTVAQWQTFTNPPLAPGQWVYRQWSGT